MQNISATGSEAPKLEPSALVSTENLTQEVNVSASGKMASDRNICHSFADEKLQINKKIATLVTPNLNARTPSTIGAVLIEICCFLAKTLKFDSGKFLNKKGLIMRGTTVS